MQMVDAWNSGRGDGFAAPFAEAADFIAFEGTHLKGRSHIQAFHQRLFDGELKGTRLSGRSELVQFVTPEVAVLHATGGTTLAGQPTPVRSRESMQLFVVRRHSNGQWRVDAVMNARKLTLERQLLWDDFESLSSQGQVEVKGLIASLRAEVTHVE
jgi:uncharacterized protein (TIGR02246 family)